MYVYIYIYISVCVWVSSIEQAWSAREHIYHQAQEYDIIDMSRCQQHPTGTMGVWWEFPRAQKFWFRGGPDKLMISVWWGWRVAMEPSLQQPHERPRLNRRLNWYWWVVRLYHDRAQASIIHPESIFGGGTPYGKGQVICLVASKISCSFHPYLRWSSHLTKFVRRWNQQPPRWLMILVSFIFSIFSSRYAQDVPMMPLSTWKQPVQCPSDSETHLKKGGALGYVVCSELSARKCRVVGGAQKEGEQNW